MTHAGVRRVAVVIGTRPEAIKLAPVVLELRRCAGFDTSVWLTGQHREMIDPVVDAFHLEPSENLGLLLDGQSLAELTARAVTGVHDLLRGESMDALVVQGDTTTAFAAALAAFYLHVPVVHVEAGLRTGNPLAPYPEEINRQLIARLAALHLSPTRLAAENLIREGTPPERIIVTGNTTIDAMRWAIAHASTPTDEPLASVESDPRPLVLFTAHRREAWRQGLRAAAEAVASIARAGDVLVVVPLHRNPIVREALVPPLRDLENVLLVEPLDYLPFCRLMARSALIVTDSGGIQEEAPSLGVPVLVLRDETERPEALATGAATLVGTDPPTVARAAARILESKGVGQRARDLYGDGRAAARCVAAMNWLFERGDRPDDFSPAVD